MRLFEADVTMDGIGSPQPPYLSAPLIFHGDRPTFRPPSMDMSAEVEMPYGLIGIAVSFSAP